MLGVRTTTLARWAREGKVSVLTTPFGHRRYWRADIIDLQRADRDPEFRERIQVVRDAVRLYDQGWDIRRVAEEFDLSYGQMRRLLLRHTTLRGPGARER